MLSRRPLIVRSSCDLMILLTTISTFDDSGDNLDQDNDLPTRSLLPMIDIGFNLWDFNTYNEILTFQQGLCFRWLISMSTCEVLILIMKYWPFDKIFASHDWWRCQLVSLRLKIQQRHWPIWSCTSCLRMMMIIIKSSWWRSSLWW